jgi:hypothetical protein
MKAAPRPRAAKPTTASVMEGAIGVCMRAAPRQHKVAPTIVTLIGGGKHKSERSVEVAMGDQEEEGAGKRQCKRVRRGGCN